MALYGIDDYEGRRVIAWGFLGMLLGARATEYVWNFSVYWNDPALIFDLNRGGLSEKGAILGAVLATFVLCRRGDKVSFFKLCEVVILPAFLAIALGRLSGCFFAGCCVGIESASPLALHFPYDVPSVTRHATQIYYSLSAALILLSLFFIEKWFLRRGCGQLPPRHVLTPLGFIFYSIMRIAVDTLRLNFDELLPSNIALAAMMPFHAAWFLTSWNAFRKKISPS
jgi:phosphatidylglycerol:prolipoprotein diacylglycerol transferase